MGEEKFEQTALVKAIHGTVAVQSQQTGDLRVDTPGGIFRFAGTRMPAQAPWANWLSFFGEFLEVSGLFQR